jgi:hypothetical protein
VGGKMKNRLDLNYAGPTVTFHLNVECDVEVDPESIHEVKTKMPGVYAFYNCTGDCLYVGKSLDLKRRLYQHMNGYSHVIKSASEIFSIPIYYVDDISELDILEMSLINVLSPSLNTKYKKASNGITKESPPEKIRDTYFHYRKFSQFYDLGDFNNVLMSFTHHYGDRLTKSEKTIIKRLAKHACKIPGVAYIKVHKLQKSLKENDDLIVSEKTVRRAMREFRALNFVDIVETRRKQGGRGHNIYVFQKSGWGRGFKTDVS